MKFHELMIACSITAAISSTATWFLVKPNQDSETLIAVADMDRALLDATKAGSEEHAQDVAAQLVADSRKLSAAGFVVIDARALVSFPPELLIPTDPRPADEPEQSEANTEEAGGEE